jgi:hypothetical protein
MLCLTHQIVQVVSMKTIKPNIRSENIAYGTLHPQGRRSRFRSVGYIVQIGKRSELKNYFVPHAFKNVWGTIKKCAVQPYNGDNNNYFKKKLTD